jgi:hypothetical protein
MGWQLIVFSEFDDVSVEILIMCAPTPRFASRLVENPGISFHCRCVCIFKIVDGQAHLSACRGASFGCIEGKMKIGASCPGDFCVDTSDPAIIDSVVARMEIESESISVEDH